MVLCSQLHLLIILTIRLLLYTGHLVIDDHLHACIITGLPAERVVATKCGAVVYLLDPIEDQNISSI